MRCIVAQSSADQARGLQGVTLGPNEGMLFPFHPPRASTFWMGAVAYPIDIVFADARGRIGRIVHAAQPGTRDRWSYPACSAVVEVRGGACARAGIDVGGTMRTYNPLRTITEAAGPPLAEGYYSHEPLETKLPREDVPPEDRFRDRRLPDEAFSEAHDQPIDGYRSQWGYAPPEPLIDEGLIGPSVRQSRRRVEVDDAGLFISAIARAVAADPASIRWRTDVLNGGATESAVVTHRDVSRWLESVGLPQRFASGEFPLSIIADGFVLAGVADLGRVAGDAVVLTRGRREAR